MSEKDEVIKNIYYDRSGYQSIQKTYQEAKQKDDTITKENVRNRFSTEWKLNISLEDIIVI